MAGLVARFEDLTREELAQRAPRSLFVWPVGSIEQHGPHLPVGADTFHAIHVTANAATIAAEQIPIVMVPPLPFGSSPHHVPFGGTMSIGTEIYYRLLTDLVESLISCGVRRLFIVNGHGGNHEVIQLVARDVALRFDVAIAAGSWWAMAWDSLVEAGATQLGGLPGHGGAFETSLLLAMQPELVTVPLPDRTVTAASNPRVFGGPYRVERHGFWQQLDGYTDSPNLANAERGRHWLEVAAKAVAQHLLDFWQSTRE
ncbi:MAG: creatinine amidohydrolase [Chloroflexota bacterium]|nr:MAG: creatinine amidohydrolase [Chloroflexota bacterium]